MPTPSKPSQTRRRGLGDRVSKPAKKPGYSPNLDLTDDHPCAPSSPFQVFTPSNTGLWPQHLSATSSEHHDFFPACEHPPIRQGDQHLTSPTPDSNSHGTTHSELSRLSTRPYSLRASDHSDFASTWEASIVPRLTDILQKHCSCDFAVDVHNFPEVSSTAVPRVIYITISSEADTTVLEQIIRAELSMIVPERFNPVHLSFRRGGVRKSQWWGDAGEKDSVCPPKNVTYRHTPVIGMSIGPTQVPDAASLGGFIKVGSNLYAMSAFHAFEDSIKACQLGVSHPAAPDFPMIVPSDPGARPYSIGSVVMCAPPGTLRPSLTFQGRGYAEDRTLVEMDWCLIGPVPNGKNVVPVPKFRDDRYVAVDSTAAVEGNTEVYAMARTSGYSLGFTSDVPGLLRMGGQLRREWTVRQYSPPGQPAENPASARWQTLKQWVTSGIGVPGDSGAWLIRRSDNALMGLVWGRNHNSGDPLERVRLTYFTPIVDILADIRERYADGQDVSLPVYSRRDLTRDTGLRGPREAVSVDMAWDPWNVYSLAATRHHRQVQVDQIRNDYVGGSVPSGPILRPQRGGDGLPTHGPSTADPPNIRPMHSSILAAAPPAARPRSGSGASVPSLHSQDKLLLWGIGLNPRVVDLSLPELTTSPSIGTGSSMADEDSEVASAGDGVRIAGEQDLGEAITDVEEAVRSKASFAAKYPSLLGFDQIVS